MPWLSHGIEVSRSGFRDGVTQVGEHAPNLHLVVLREEVAKVRRLPIGDAECGRDFHLIAVKRDLQSFAKQIVLRDMARIIRGTLPGVSVVGAVLEGHECSLCLPGTPVLIACGFIKREI